MTMMSKELIDYIALYSPQIQAILAEFEANYQKAGFSGDLIPDKENINYSLLKDDFSGEFSLQGVWNNSHGYKQGMLLFHPDGNFFAEYDVVKPHPKKKQWFVEAITVWGKESDIKSEPRLIPAVE
ncbi:MAG: hypothetical protein R3240_12895 [Gammaproteobacteria bacterium]|nr:hypothetical protein [Gammaproteobacteria bacterium]